MNLSEKCLCETITYEITGPARPVVNCHCSRCRSHTGHFMAATADLLSIAAGTISPPTGLGTEAAIYTNHASDYHAFDDSILSHGEDFPGSS